NFDLSPRLCSDHFAFRFTGYIQILRAGAYTFFLNSDDGSQLFIGTNLVVNNGGLHSAREISGVINLQPGLQPIRVLFFENTRAELREVSWQGPGFARQPIPDSTLYRNAASELAPEFLGAGTVARETDFLYAYAPSIMYDETEGLYKWWACYNGPLSTGGGDY